ncbi:phosphoenolpyruvate--protein phosphotransferase [Acidobacteriota bacterium]
MIGIKERRTGRSNKLRGKIITPGIAFGYAHHEELVPSYSSLTIKPEAVEHEMARLESAVSLVRKHLEDHVREFHSPAEEDFRQIISLHALALDDLQFFSLITRRVKCDLVSAEKAVEEEFSAAAQRLSASGDPYLQARTEDLRDICQLVQKALVYGIKSFQPLDSDLSAPVFISSHLRPSAVLRARRAGAVAFVTSSSAFSSHGAILLRVGGIPSLGGVALSDTDIEEGMPLLVDAIHGEVQGYPSKKARGKAFDLAKRFETLDTQDPLPPQAVSTANGRKIHILANIDHPSQTMLCLQHRLHGIGLFRTEFLALDSGRIPDEEEQYKTYRRVIELLEGRPIVIRTFDIGGDKIMSGLHQCSGPNPALGIRGIRRHLHNHPQEFLTQLRAILRAALDADVAVLFPMVTHTGDILAARFHLKEACAELEREGVLFNRNVKVGAMIEVPSAALGIAKILETVDFVSIGTNDLLQYLTAADRDNPEVITYLDIDTSELCPLLEYIVNEARSVGRERDVSVCGEMASDPDGARFLVRIGVTSLSISPGSSPSIRNALEPLHVSRRARVEMP